MQKFLLKIVNPATWIRAMTTCH